MNAMVTNNPAILGIRSNCCTSFYVNESSIKIIKCLGINLIIAVKDIYTETRQALPKCEFHL